tara:strand:- start:9163 stop:9687 length:525 start_codon:yes stop_codon:yes gene_type:complete
MNRDKQMLKLPNSKFPNLTNETIQEIETFLENDGKAEYNNHPIDAYFNGVRGGITEYHGHLLKQELEDNPVPSIDALVLELVDIRNSSKNIPIEVYHKICDIEKKFLKLTENGVETANEQPKTFICSNDNGETWFTWYMLTATVWSVNEPESRHCTTEELLNNTPGYTICKPVY